jgi:phosphoribosylformylglycinamidine synthase PurS subunit
MLKQGILDNAGKATTRALTNMGFDTIMDVKIGKTFEIECDPSNIEKVAQSLRNQVMEDYFIEELK